MLEERSNSFKQQLKDKGYKITTQRQAVIDCLVNNEGRHLSPEEIYSIVKEDYPDIGLATVYRTLTLFSKMKLVHKINFDDGFNRYELNRNHTEHRHHHLICMKCGSVTEVREDLFDSIEDDILRKYGFIVKDHKVKFYGYCRNCMKEG